MSSPEKPVLAQTSERLDSTSSDTAPQPSKPSIGTRAKRFLRRWWWLVLIIFIICVLIIILPLVFVGFPRIAQNQVNDSTLKIGSQLILSPTNDSFRLIQLQSIHSDSSLHPRLDAFSPIIFLADTLSNPKPIFSIDIPALVVRYETNIPIDQHVQIQDLNEFNRYVATVLGSEEYRLGVRGRTGLKQKGLRKMTVDYNEVVTLKGLNKLNGFNVTEFSIMRQPAPDGSNMAGKVFIPNPSVLTFELGNVTLNLSVQDDPIGTALLPGLVIHRGDNTVDMRATIDRAKVLQKLAAFPDGFLPVDIVGNSTVNRGQHLAYYEEALRRNKMSVRLNVGAALSGLISGGGGGGT